MNFRLVLKLLGLVLVVLSGCMILSDLAVFLMDPDWDGENSVEQHARWALFACAALGLLLP